MRLNVPFVGSPSNKKDNIVLLCITGNISFVLIHCICHTLLVYVFYHLVSICCTVLPPSVLPIINGHAIRLPFCDSINRFVILAVLVDITQNSLPRYCHMIIRNTVTSLLFSVVHPSSMLVIMTICVNITHFTP